MAEPSLVPLALRIARRELRGGIEGFRIFLACLAIGVAAIAAVGSISASMVGGLNASARDILGGDAEFRLSQRELPGNVVAWLAAHGRVSEVRQLRAMVRRPDGSARTLIELKAVDQAYPLSGSVPLDPLGSLENALAIHGGVAGIAVDPLVLERLNAHVGDRVLLGDAAVEIRAAMLREPDAATNPFSFGPHVLISVAGLAATGLDRPGTLSSTSYRVLLPPGADPAAFIREANTRFPEIVWQARDLAHAAPGIQAFVDRTGLFLTLVGLTALLVGGVGVGNAAASYLDGKTSVIATLKCLGAPARLVCAVYMAQILALALAGILIGLAAGASAPWAVQWLAGDLLPIPLQLQLYPGPLGLATAFGLLTTVAFSLWPLARARGVSPASLFRSAIVPTPVRLRRGDWIAMAVLGLGIVALALGTADDRRLAAWSLLALAVAFAVFRGAGSLVVAAARRMGRPRRPWLRLAIANLYRPGAPTGSVVLSLGLGLTVLVAVALVQESLSKEVNGRLSESAPSFFFIDIQPDQSGPLARLVASIPGTSGYESVPSLRARIAKINGVPAAEARIEPDERPLVQSEHGLSYTGTLPKGSHVVEGEWWPADYRGPPLISLDRNRARGLHLKVGDTLTYDIAGRQVTGRIANLRRIDWSTLGINFFAVFAPGALEPAPQTKIAIVKCATPAVEEQLSKAVTDAFPNVSVIRVRDELQAVAKMLSGLAAVIRATAAISILTGGLVLAGAIAAGHAKRVYDSVILKVLGATRPMMARGFALEYGLLGTVTAVLSVALGTLAAWLVVVHVMRADWSFDPALVALTAIGGPAVTIAVALAVTWRALGERAALHLRND